MMGIEWLQRHLGEQYKIHVLSFDNANPMHIDATINIIGPGLLIVNPDRPCDQLEIFERAGNYNNVWGFPSEHKKYYCVCI